ncbi:hypothetical protein ACVW2K_003477 [Nocardioides sp. HB32]
MAGPEISADVLRTQAEDYQVLGYDPAQSR